MRVLHVDTSTPHSHPASPAHAPREPRGRPPRKRAPKPPGRRSQHPAARAGRPSDAPCNLPQEIVTLSLISFAQRLSGVLTVETALTTKLQRSTWLRGLSFCSITKDRVTMLMPVFQASSDVQKSSSLPPQPQPHTMHTDWTRQHLSGCIWAHEWSVVVFHEVRPYEKYVRSLPRTLSINQTAAGNLAYMLRLTLAQSSKCA